MRPRQLAASLLVVPLALLAEQPARSPRNAPAPKSGKRYYVSCDPRRAL